MINKLIFVLSGPSGAGKSTLISHLLDNMGSAALTVSHTTRPPRETETNGVDYHFVTLTEFDRMVQAGEFVEHVSCYGNRYGTSKQSVKDVLSDKDICILDLDFEGAYNVLANNFLGHKCVGILILPPSIKTLKKRLSDRKTESEENLNRRLAESFNVNKIARYDHVIINADLAESKRELLEIVRTYL